LTEQDYFQSLVAPPLLRLKSRLRFGFQEAVSKKRGYKNEDLETILSDVRQIARQFT